MIFEFKKEKSNLLELGRRKRREGDITASVSAYRSALKEDPFDYDTNAELAEILTESDLYSQALSCWYRALSVATESEKIARVYNGLGANYFFLGNDFSAFTCFGLQIAINDEEEFVYNDIISDIQEEMFFQDGEPQFKLVHDADSEEKSSAEIERAREMVSQGKSNDALALLSGISEDSPHYLTALEEICFILILQGRYDTAEDVAMHVLEKDGASFLANLAMCSSCYNTGRAEKSEEYYLKLKALVSSEDRRLQMLMLSLDVGRDEDALVYAQSMLDENPTNFNIMFVRGLIRYNLGDIENAKNDFYTVNTFTPSLSVKKVLKTALLPIGERPEKMEYDLDVKTADLKIFINEIGEGLEKIKERANVSFEDLKNIADCIIGCKMTHMFKTVIQLGFAIDAGRTYEYLREKLLDVDVIDTLKRIIVKELVLLGINAPVKCVVSNTYRSFKIDNVRFTGLFVDLFEDIYAEVVTNLYLVGENVDKLKRRIKTYKTIYEENGGGADGNPAALGAAIFKMLKVNLLSDDKVIAEIFSVTEEELKEALKVFKRKD